MQSELTNMAIMMDNEIDALSKNYKSGNTDVVLAHYTAEWLRESSTELFLLAENLADDDLISDKDYNIIYQVFRNIREKTASLQYILTMDGAGEKLERYKHVGRTLCKGFEIPFPSADGNGRIQDHKDGGQQ